MHRTGASVVPPHEGRGRRLSIARNPLIRGRFVGSDSPAEGGDAPVSQAGSSHTDQLLEGAASVHHQREAGPRS